MLLHIGNGKTVRGGEIVGIFDLDNATVSKESRAYLSHATRAGEVSYADSDIPRSFLVVAGKQKPKRSIAAPTANHKITKTRDVGLAPAADIEETQPAVGTPRRRHPARNGGKRITPPAQTVLLSHISSGALRTRCERPLLDED